VKFRIERSELFKIHSALSKTKDFILERGEHSPLIVEVDAVHFRVTKRLRSRH